MEPAVIIYSGMMHGVLKRETEDWRKVSRAGQLVAFLIATTKYIMKQLELGRVMVAHGGGLIPSWWGGPGTGERSHCICTGGAEGKHSVFSWFPSAFSSLHSRIPA